MWGRADEITKAIRSYDPKLYCEKDRDGKLCVYRKSQRVEAYDFEGQTLLNVLPSPHFIFALTDNWKSDGRSVNWGLMPILERIKAIDLWNRDLAEECLEREEKAKVIREKDARNSMENFLYDYRGQFKSVFKDINTSSLEKIDKRKEL